MMRKKLSSAAPLIIILTIIGFIWSLFGYVELWDGGFPQIEFQVTFLDKQEKPIKGVTLSVTDCREALTFGYPVTDFKEDSIPYSNNDGLMVFHHVNLTPEFGGKCRMLFFFIPIGECEAPYYTLHFNYLDKEIARYEYRNYLGVGTPHWGSLHKINRQLSEIGDSPKSLPEHLRLENRHMPSTLEYRVIARTFIFDEIVRGKE